MVLKRKQRHRFCHTNITEEALAPPEGLGLFAVTHFPELMAILMAAWEALVSRLFSAPTLERVEGSRAALWCPSGSTLSRYAEYYGILGSFGIKMVGKERKVTCSF